MAELALYRAVHAGRTGLASPLALDILAHAGIPLEQAVDRLGPNGRWPVRFCGPHPDSGFHHGRRWHVPAGCRSTANGLRATFLHGAKRVVSGKGCPSAPGGDAMVRLSEDGLEIATKLGSARLVTRRGVALLSSGLPVPDVIKAALPGRPLDVMFSHPVLSGRGYVVDEVREGRLGFHRGEWGVLFAAPMVPWRVPRSWSSGWLAVAALLGMDTDRGGTTPDCQSPSG